MSVCSPKVVKKAAHFSVPQASSGGQVGWRGMAMSRGEKRCCVCLFVCYKTILARAAVSQNHQVHRPLETLQQRDGCLVLHV